MKKLCFASLLLMSGLAQADTVEWDYTNTLTGSITELLSGSPIAGNAVYATEKVTGTLDVSLLVNNNNNALSLVSYDVDLLVSNGVAFKSITGTDLTNPAYLTVTGATTCASASFEILGCITLSPNKTASIAANSTDSQGADLILTVGVPADEVSFANAFCAGTPAYIVTITGNKNGVCSADLGSTTPGQWTEKAAALAAPELEASSAAGVMSLFGGLLMVVQGRRRRHRTQTEA